MAKHDVAREISYASSAQSQGGRVLIRALENATGRLSLIRRAAAYGNDVAQGQNFWNVLVNRHGLSLDIIGGARINFSDHNSRLFGVACYMHSNMRVGLLIKEFRARVLS